MLRPGSASPGHLRGVQPVALLITCIARELCHVKENRVYVGAVGSKTPHMSENTNGNTAEGDLVTQRFKIAPECIQSVRRARC